MVKGGLCTSLSLPSHTASVSWPVYNMSEPQQPISFKSFSLLLEENKGFGSKDFGNISEIVPLLWMGLITVCEVVSNSQAYFVSVSQPGPLYQVAVIG